MCYNNLIFNILCIVHKQSITIWIKSDFYEMTQSIACMAINLFCISIFYQLGSTYYKTWLKHIFIRYFDHHTEKKYKEFKFFYISLKNSGTLRLQDYDILAFFCLAYSFTNRFLLISWRRKIFNEKEYDLKGH